MLPVDLFRGVCGCLFSVVLIGCVERPLGGGETGSSGGVTGGETTVSSGVTPTTGVDPSSPGTSMTTGPGTTATSLTTTTSDDSGVTTVDPSATTSGGTKLDVAVPSGVPGGIVNGCTKEPPGASAIKGESALGPSFSTRAYFGYYDFGGALGGPRLLFLDETADPELAFTELAQSFEVLTGPAVHAGASLEFSRQNPFWLGVDEEALLLVKKGGEGALVVARIEITGHEGNWDQVSPGDPARLRGTIAPGGDPFMFAGDFDAVFCDLLVQQVIAE